MYQVDDLDRVVELEHVPQSSVGAPIPILLASEHGVAMAYYLQETPDNWDGTNPRMISPDTQDEPVAIIVFEDCYTHMFGPPNDEAFSGHPLYSRGLAPYSVYEIENSSWLRSLERMNAVHPYHDRIDFMNGKKHFIFAFHDSTFECIAKGFKIEIHRGSVAGMISRMCKLIEL